MSYNAALQNACSTTLNEGVVSMCVKREGVWEQGVERRSTRFMFLQTGALVICFNKLNTCKYINSVRIYRLQGVKSKYSDTTSTDIHVTISF